MLHLTNRKLSFLCMFEHSGFGADSAAPVVKEIMDAYFHFGKYAKSAASKDSGTGGKS